MTRTKLDLFTSSYEIKGYTTLFAFNCFDKWMLYDCEVIYWMSFENGILLYIRIMDELGVHDTNKLS